MKEEEFDLVVLSVGMNPPADAEGLANKFGIELNSHGFCKTNPVNPIETTRPGNFRQRRLPGSDGYPRIGCDRQRGRCAVRPTACLPARKAGQERIYPPERDVSGETAKVGVFVCHCGANIGRVVDVPSVVEYALTLPNVVHAEESLFACSTNTAQANIGHDPGKRTQSRGRRRLHPEDA